MSFYLTRLTLKGSILSEIWAKIFHSKPLYIDTLRIKIERLLRRLLNDQNDWYNVLGSGEPYQFKPPVLEEECYASNDSFDGLQSERMIQFPDKWLLWKRRYIIEINMFRNSLRKFCDLLPLPHAVSLFGFCCVRAHVELRFECECKCRMVLLFRVIYIHVQHVVMWCS